MGRRWEARAAQLRAVCGRTEVHCVPVRRGNGAPTPFCGHCRKLGVCRRRVSNRGGATCYVDPTGNEALPAAAKPQRTPAPAAAAQRRRSRLLHLGARCPPRRFFGAKLTRFEGSAKTTFRHLPRGHFVAGVCRLTAVAYCPSRYEGQCIQVSISCVACRRSHRLIIARTSSFLKRGRPG